jgi:hypothetical protein
MGHHSGPVSVSGIKKPINFHFFGKSGFFVALLEKARNRPMRDIRHQGGKLNLFFALKHGMPAKPTQIGS